MTTGRIDVHAHLIPGVDDGCATVADALACAQLLAGAGYTHAFCTPHVWPQLPGNTAASIRQGTAALQRELDRANIPLRLLSGGEINLQSCWPAIGGLPLSQIVTYALAGEYLLFDFWAEDFPDFLEPAVRHLQSLGLKLVMAHPERLRMVQNDSAAAGRLGKLGLLLQCNAGCLMDPPGTPTRDVSERLLRDGRYFMLGTDCHNAAGLPNRLQGVQRAIELVGEQAVHDLTVTHPRRLLAMSE